MTLVALLTPGLALVLVLLMQRLERGVLTQTAVAAAGGPSPDDLRDETLGQEIELLTDIIAAVGRRERHLTDPEVDRALGLDTEAEDAGDRSARRRRDRE